MCTLDLEMPSLASRRHFISAISSCNSLNKVHSSSVIALYNSRRFIDHCEDADDITADDPDLVSEDDLDPDCDPVS